MQILREVGDNRKRFVGVESYSIKPEAGTGGYEGGQVTLLSAPRWPKNEVTYNVNVDVDGSCCVDYERAYELAELLVEELRDR